MSEIHAYSQPPRTLSEAEFVARFGGVYEHSAWVAETLHRQGLSATHDSAEGLSDAMAAIVDAAGDDRQMALILAHPDLAGRAAQRGELTPESTREQAGAGIGECTPEEFERFQTYNAAYKAKFGFPFIMAVKGANRHLILAGFEERLNNDLATERARALAEIHKIARFRLVELAGG